MANISLGIDSRGASRGGRVVRGELDAVKSKARRTQAVMGGFGRSSGSAMNVAATGTLAFGKAVSQVRVGVIALGAAMAAAITVGFRSANGLDAALAESSTLIAGTTEEMALMRAEARAMASDFGGGTTAQVEAFYQAISAGAGTVAQASELLSTANALAKGGVTDITTSVDILTTAVNAYAGSGLTAADASDILFTGVKFGKTTIDELASSLGRAAPLAGKLGVGFDELVASTAALTKGGVSTAEAVTGIKGVLAAVLKPSKQAEEAAASMGLEFNAAAIQSKGLAGFLQDVIEKTGGSAEKLAMLFNGLEGLGGVLGLATNGGHDFNAAMDEMSNRFGATEEAANKISSSLSDRLDVSMGKIALKAESVGTILLTLLVPALEFVAENADLFAVALGTVIVAVGGLKLAALISSIRGVGLAFGIAYHAVVGFQTAMALVGGPIGAIIIGVSALVTGLYYLATRHDAASRAAAEHAAWEAKVSEAMDSAKSSLNSYSRSTEIDTAAITQQYGEMANRVIAHLRRVADVQLGLAISETMKSVKSSFSEIDGITDGFDAEIQSLEQSLEGLNVALYRDQDNPVQDQGIRDKLDALRQAQAVLEGTAGIVADANVEIGKLGVPASVFQDFVQYRAALEEALGTGAWNDAFDAVGHLTDLLNVIPDGPLRDAILAAGMLTEDLAGAAVSAGQVSTEAETITPAIAAATAEANRLSDALLGAVSAANRLDYLQDSGGGRGSGAEYDAQRGGAGSGQTYDEWLASNPVPSSSGSSGGGAGTGAAETALDLTERTKAAYDSLRGSMDEAFAAQTALADGQLVVNEALAAGSISTEQAASALEMLKDRYKVATDAGYAMQEQIVSSIAQSMGDALMSVVDGTKSVADAFKTMALAIAKELFDVIVIQQLVLALKGAMGFADGGVISGGNVMPNATGNAFGSGNVIPFASGGVVTSPTLFPMNSGIGLMGEAGPEAIMPLTRGKDGKLGVKNSGDGGSKGDGSSGGDGGTTILNVLDPAIVGNFLNTAEGRRVIMNIIGEEQAA